MQTIAKITFCLLALLGGGMITGCSSQDEPVQNGQPADNMHTCSMTFDVEKPSYEAAPNARSVTEWEDGDKIFLTFTVGGKTVSGSAEYRNSKWTVSYFGNLTVTSSAKCAAVYFENPVSMSGTVASLSEQSCIYEDTAGMYSFNGEDLTVTASLKPKTGRLRFKAEDSQCDSLTVYGITYYTSYDATTGKYGTAAYARKVAVSDGYTPYIYGYYTDSTQPRLNLFTKESGFTKFPPKTTFQAGQSGYMTLPTVAMHDGWSNVLRLKLQGVEFTMIPVEYANGNFMLAETETTRELCMKYYPDVNYTASMQYPAQMVSSNWDVFINNIVNDTGLKFRYPTNDEWKFAAKGGKLSRNYTYAGSNNIDEVAWYSGNSGNSLHDVKQKLPNELGFYDMSGNAKEWAGKNGSSSRYYYGGGYSSDASYCVIGSYSSSSYESFGLRMALSN